MVCTYYVCDRCGKKQTDSFKKVGRFELVSAGKEIEPTSWKQKIDICEECQKALEDFMDGPNLI